jgi:aminopeptidase N
VAAQKVTGNGRSTSPKANQKGRIHYEGHLPALERDRDHRSVLGGMPPMAAPEGSFLSSGSGWYPRPADLFSYRVKLAVPYGQRALVAGKRIAETLPAKTGESYRASFEFTQPSDGIDLMAGPWVVREKTVKRGAQPPLHLRTFFPADLDAMPGLAQPISTTPQPTSHATAVKSAPIRTANFPSSPARCPQASACRR